MNLTVVILTLNEARHIERAIQSIKGIANRVIVVDSGSTDQTVALARSAGAEVLTHTFITHSQQFNWSISQLPSQTEWILRLDSDEILSPTLATEMRQELGSLGPEIDGVYVSRRMTFLGRTIRHGGVFPIRVLRLFRHGRGRCENRWMDEHIIVSGPTANFRGEILDDNLNSLTWWTQKHNTYASREAIDILNREYGFMPYETVADLRGGQAGMKRWVKERLYSRFPGGFRAFAYFFYRYVIRLGFLDGREGLAFHFLQAFWYRFLVDAKLFELKKFMEDQGVDPVTAIDQVLGIKIR